MKKADLEKHLGKKIERNMRQQATPDRYGSAAGLPADRKAQREREKASGLVPFAVKLPAPLVSELQALAQARNANLNELVADLLRSSLADAHNAP